MSIRTEDSTRRELSKNVRFGAVAQQGSAPDFKPLSLFRQVHLGVGKSEYNPSFSGLRAASTWEAVGFCGSHRQTDVLAKLSSWLGGWSSFCGDNGRHTAQVREWRSLRCRQSPLSWEIGRAATLLKTLLQYYGKSLEALPGVAYPGFRDNRSTLNTKTRYI